MTWLGHRWLKLLELSHRRRGILLFDICIAPSWPSLALKDAAKCHQELQSEDALTDSFPSSFHPTLPPQCQEPG